MYGNITTMPIPGKNAIANQRNCLFIFSPTRKLLVHVFRNLWCSIITAILCFLLIKCNQLAREIAYLVYLIFSLS